MTRGSPRTSLNSSRLIRVLADMTATAAAAPKQSFAERLSQWLDFNDAISLFSALKTSGTEAQSVPAAGLPVQEQVARVRATLGDSITTDGVFKTGKTRIKLPTPAPEANIENAADFVPYHRYYLAHQRDMNSSISQLRAHARTTLAGVSPNLKRLAALDAAMDEILAARERNLFATVPLFLARRYEQLRKGHQEALAGSMDDPARWMEPGGWLAIFCRDMQGVLLAELDVRLQPVEGLVEAFGNEVTKQQ